MHKARGCWRLCQVLGAGLQSFRLINAKEAYEDLAKGGPRREQPHPEEALVSGETSEGKVSGPYLKGTMWLTAPGLGPISSWRASE